MARIDVGENMVNKNNKKKGIRGRHSLPEGEKKRYDGLSNTQYERLKKESSSRGIDTRQLLRQIVDWYFTAIDTKRGDAEKNKIFDNIVTPSE